VRGENGGLGIAFARRSADIEAPYTITALIAAGAAEKSGLLAVGERIVAVDATAVARLQVENVTALIRGSPDTPVTLTIAPAEVGVPPCDTAPARTPVSRKLGRVRSLKSRSPKEVSALVDRLIMARPDLAVDAPQGLLQRAGVSTNLTKMLGIYVYMYMYTLTHTYARASARAHTHTRTHARTHTHTHTCMHMHVYVSHIHTHIHTHTHTHT
jgi:hypothetical protein